MGGGGTTARTRVLNIEVRRLLLIEAPDKDSCHGPLRQLFAIPAIKVNDVPPRHRHRRAD